MDMPHNAGFAGSLPPNLVCIIFNIIASVVISSPAAAWVCLCRARTPSFGPPMGRPPAALSPHRSTTPSAATGWSPGLLFFKGKSNPSSQGGNELLAPLFLNMLQYLAFYLSPIQTQRTYDFLPVFVPTSPLSSFFPNLSIYSQTHFTPDQVVQEGPALLPCHVADALEDWKPWQDLIQGGAPSVEAGIGFRDLEISCGQVGFGKMVLPSYARLLGYIGCCPYPCAFLKSSARVG